MKNEITKKTEIINLFMKTFMEGIDNLTSAADIYIKALDSGEVTKEQFKESLPGIPPTAWNGLEALGRGWIDKRLLWGGGKAGSFLRRLPKSDQTKALNEGVELLINDSEMLIVKVETMTKEQCEQVFDQSHIRSIGEQRAFLSTISTTADPIALSTIEKECPYEIKNGKLIIRTPLVMTKTDLQKLIKRM